MATSGTYAFGPTVAEFTDEAFERCGLDPAAVTARHLRSARRSMNLLLADWLTDGVRQWKIDLQTQATTVGGTSFAPPAGTVDVFDMMLRRDDSDTPVERISRDDYMQIADKATEGRPDRFFFDRGLTQAVVHWPAGENTTDEFRYYRLVRMQDVGVPSNTPDIPPHWFEAFAAGVAAKLAQKFAPARWGDLKADAAAAFRRARYEDRDRAPVTLNVRYGR